MYSPWSRVTRMSPDLKTHWQPTLKLIRLAEYYCKNRHTPSTCGHWLIYYSKKLVLRTRIFSLTNWRWESDERFETAPTAGFGTALG